MNLGERVVRVIIPLVAVASMTGADEPDKARIESEAIGQAAEADRLFKAGDYAAALPLYEAERASRAKLGDVRQEAYATRAVGCCHEGLGDLEAALVALEAARRLDSRRDDKGYEGYDLLLIGRVQFRLGRVEEAHRSLARAIPPLSTAIDRDHEADARLVMARVLTVLDRPEQAPEHLDRARALALDLKDPKRHADACAESARVALAMGEPGPASEWLSDARDAYEDQGLAAEVAAMDRMMGGILLDLGLPGASYARVELAARAHETLRDPSALADDLEFLAELAAEEGALDRARALSRRAVDARRDADDPSGEVEARVLLARCQSLSDDWAGAAETLSRAVVLVRRDGVPSEQVRLLILAADVERRARHAARADALLDEAGKVAVADDNGALKALVADARRRAR
jgi:tetratricopeptide (TPR) repeat protein